MSSYPLIVEAVPNGCGSPHRRTAAAPLIVEAVPNGRPLGVFYWEATRTAVTGNGWDPTDATSANGWENQAQFGYVDKALSSMGWFSHR